MTSWTAACQASLSITNSWSLLKLVFIESVMASNHLILCHPLLLLYSIFLSIRVFSNESLLRIRWPEYWSFSFSISPSNEFSGLISFRMDRYELLAVQGDPEESSPTPQFKSINSLALSFLYRATSKRNVENKVCLFRNLILPKNPGVKEKIKTEITVSLAGKVHRSKHTLYYERQSKFTY